MNCTQPWVKFGSGSRVGASLYKVSTQTRLQVTETIKAGAMTLVSQQETRIT